MAIAQVQKGFATNGDNFVSVVLGATPTSGHLLVAVVYTNQHGAPVTFTSGGGTWFQAESMEFVGGSSTVEIWYKVCTSGESATITANNASPATQMGLSVAQYSGMDTDPANVLDRVGSAASAGTTLVNSQTTGTTLATRQASELAIAGVAVNGTGTVFDNWNNSFLDQHGPRPEMAHKILSAMATQTTTMTWTGSPRRAGGVIATFRAAVGGGTVTITDSDTGGAGTGGSPTDLVLAPSLSSPELMTRSGANNGVVWPVTGNESDPMLDNTKDYNFSFTGIADRKLMIDGGGDVIINAPNIDIEVHGGPMMEVRKGASDRIVYLYGANFHDTGKYRTDAIRTAKRPGEPYGAGGHFDTGAGGTILKIKRSHIWGIVGSDTPAIEVHADGIQIVRGIKEMWIEDSTFQSGYVGMQLQREQFVSTVWTGGSEAPLNISSATHAVEGTHPDGRTKHVGNVLITGGSFNLSVGDWIEIDRQHDYKANNEIDLTAGHGYTGAEIQNAWKGTWKVIEILAGTPGSTVTRFKVDLDESAPPTMTGNGMAQPSGWVSYTGRIVFNRVNFRWMLNDDGNTPSNPVRTMTAFRVGGRPDHKGNAAEDRSATLIMAGVDIGFGIHDCYVEPNPGEDLMDMIEPSNGSSVPSFIRPVYITAAAYATRIATSGFSVPPGYPAVGPFAYWPLTHTKIYDALSGVNAVLSDGYPSARVYEGVPPVGDYYNAAPTGGPGGSTETASISVLKSSSDSGIGTQSQTIILTVLSSDAGLGSEAVARIQFPQADANNPLLTIEAVSTTTILPAVGESGIGSNAETVIVGTALINGSDTGGGTDGVSLLTATVTAPGDAGLGIEITQYILTVQGVDQAGAGTDAGSITATVTTADTGLGAQDVARIQFPQADNGTGVEAAVIDASITAADSGAGADSNAGPTITEPDTGTGADEPVHIIVSALTETGAGIETPTSTSISVSQAETGTGSDAAAPTVTDTDSGGGTDDAYSILVAGADTGVGTETTTPEVSATLTSPDSATGADISSSVSLMVTEDGAGTDAEELDVGTALVNGSDVGFGTDNATITTTILDSDSGSGSDTYESTGVGSAESGVGTETQSLSVSDAQSGVGVDAVSTITVAAAETGVGTDGSVLTVTDHDIGVGVDDAVLTSVTADSGVGIDGAHSIALGAIDAGLGTDLETVVVTDSDSGVGAEALDPIELAATERIFVEEIEAIFADLVDSDSGIGIDTEILAPNTTSGFAVLTNNGYLDAVLLDDGRTTVVVID